MPDLIKQQQQKKKKKDEVEQRLRGTDTGTGSSTPKSTPAKTTTPTVQKPGVRKTITPTTSTRTTDTGTGSGNTSYVKKEKATQNAKTATRKRAQLNTGAIDTATARKQAEDSYELAKTFADSGQSSAYRNYVAREKARQYRDAVDKNALNEAIAAEQRKDRLRTWDLDKARNDRDMMRQEAEAAKFGIHQLTNQMNSAAAAGDHSTVLRLNQQIQTLREQISRYEGMDKDYQEALSLQWQEKGDAFLSDLDKTNHADWANIDLVARSKVFGIDNVTGNLAALSVGLMTPEDAVNDTIDDAAVEEALKNLRAAGYKPDDIDLYIEWRKRQIESERTRDMIAAAQQLTSDDLFSASMGGRILNAFSGGGAYSALADNLAGRPVDYNSSAMMPAIVNNAMLRQAGEDIQKNNPGLGGQVLSELYQLGMSSIDSKVNQAATLVGIPHPLALAVMASNAASAGMLQAHERGLSDDQVVATGLVTGLAEYVTESVKLTSLAEIFEKSGDLKKLPLGKLLTGVGRDYIAQAIEEGEEEIWSDIINLVYDVYANGDKSEFRMAIQDYLSTGLTEEEATQKAVADQVLETLKSGLGGMIMGGMAGGGASIANSVHNSATANKFRVGMSSAEGTQARIAAEAFQEVVEQLNEKSEEEITPQDHMAYQAALDQLTEAIDAMSPEETKVAKQKAKQIKAAESAMIKASKAVKKGLNQNAGQTTQLDTHRYSSDAVVQDAATLVATGEQNKVATAISNVMKNEAAQKALGLTFEGKISNTAKRTQIREALEQLVKTTQETVLAEQGAEPAVEVNNSKPGATVEEGQTPAEATAVSAEGVGEDDIDLDKVQLPETLPSYEEYERGVLEHNPDATTEQIRQDYNELAKSYELNEKGKELFHSVKEEIAQFVRDATEREGKKVYLREAKRAVGYTEYVALARQYTHDDGSAWTQNELRAAFDAGVTATMEDVSKYEVKRRSKLDAMAEAMTKAFEQRGLGFKARVSYGGTDFSAKSVKEIATVSGNEIIFNGDHLETPEALVWYLGHEVVHPAARVDNKLVDTILDTFKKLQEAGKLSGELGKLVKNLDAHIEYTRNLYQDHENELAKKAERKPRTIDTAYAREEVAADLMRYAFDSTKLCRDITGVRTNVATRMRQAVTRVMDAMTGKSETMQEVRSELQVLADRLDSALDAVAQNSSRKIDPESGKPVELGVHQPGAEQYSICGYEIRDYKPDVRLSSSDFELRLAKKGGAYVYLSGREVLAQLLAKNGVSDEVASKVLDYMDSAAEFMRRAGVTYRNIGLQDVNNAKIEVRMDEEGNPISFVLSAMVKNGEYPVNFDLTQICKRREALSKYLNKLLADHPFSTFSLDRRSLQQLAKILSEEGYDTACLGCFVEAKRFYMEEFVTKFVDKWNAAVKKINPDAGYFGFSEVDTEVTDKMVGEADELLEAWRAANTKTKDEKTARNQAMAERLRTEGITDEVIADIIASNEEGHRVLEIEQRDNPDAKFKTAKYVSDSVVRDLKAGKLPSIKYVIEHVYSGSEANNTEKVENLVATGEVFQKLLTPEDLLTTHGLLKFTKLSSALPGLLSGSYGSGAPKLAQGFVPYNNEIAYLPDTVSKKSLNEYLQGIAGLRSQSFSDFKIENVFDYLQMVADLTARGLPAHMYTKEIACARILGMCGVKVNMSVMFTVEGVDYWGDEETAKKYAGLRRDKNGNLVYSFADRAAREARLKEDGKEIFVQSIDVDDAMELQKDPDYSPYVGIIGVGYGDLHIRMMLRDDNFRYVIPYHRSGLPVEIRDLTNLDLAENYTDTQNTMKFVVMETVDGKKQPVDLKRLGVTFATADEFLRWVKDNGYELRTTKAFGGHGDFDLYGDLARTQDPRQTAKNYQQWCWDQGLLPLFYQFMDEENYYKLLYDFAVTDANGNFAPQEAVHLWDAEGNITGMKKNAFTEKGLVGREMAAQNERNEELYSPEKVERVAQRMYDEVRYDSEPRFSISREMDTEYLELAKDPTKNAARLQELVDEAARLAGYPLRLRHGTNSFGFTTVEFGQSDDSISFFATDSEEVAGSYVRPVSDESDEPSTYIRPIGRPAKTRLTEKSSAADILAQLKKLAPEAYEGVRAATEQQLKQIVDETFSYVKELAAQLDRYSLPDRLQTMAQQVMQAKTAQEAVDLVESVSDVNEIIYNGMVFVQAEGTLESLRAFTDTLKARISMTPQNTAIRENDGRLAPVAATSLYEDYLDLTGMSGRGIYDIYTTANNPLVIDCRNGWWNNIRLTGEIAADLGERATTREIAKWAHEHNYGTVIFENVHDTGMYGSRFTPASTVYAFLKGGNNSFKSADPVTYDDKGEVIPLSERFNTEEPDIRFSLDLVSPVQPSTDGWLRTIDTQEALRRFPGLWNVTAEESEVRNPTQIKSTVSTYRKIYDLLKAEGFDGTILDASSGLGYGTRAGREEYGFDVDDIEPYPDASYKPRYTDYSKLNKTYDAIISNAVLNVLPQDQRDALVVKMGEMLNPGGKMYINVRGKDVDTLASSKDNVRISPMEWYVASTGSYQKGFTKAELKAYLEDALGPGYTVETTSKFGGVAVIVTKASGASGASSVDGRRFSIDTYDSEDRELSPGQQYFFRNSKAVDRYGKLLRMYHGTPSMGFTTFDTSGSGGVLFFTDKRGVARSYSGSSGKDTYSVDARTDLEQFGPKEIKSFKDAVRIIRQHGYSVDLKEDTVGADVVRSQAEWAVHDGKEMLDGLFTDALRKKDTVDKNSVEELYRYFQDVNTTDTVKALLQYSRLLSFTSLFGIHNEDALEYYRETADNMRQLANAYLAGGRAYIVHADDGFVTQKIMTKNAIENLAESFLDQPTPGLYAVYLNVTNPLVIDCLGLGWNELMFPYLIDPEVDRYGANEHLRDLPEWDGDTTREICAYAQENGYDGVIFKNVVDFGGHAAEGMDEESTVITVFNSNQAKSVTNDNPTEDPDIRFSISPTYESSLDLWDSRSRPADWEFTLGTTSDALLGLGAQDRSVYMTAEKISTILATHPGMSLDIIKKVPKVLEKPTLILRSRGQNAQGNNTRLVVYGSLTDNNNAPVAVVFDLAPTENGVPVSDLYKVNSAYGKDDVNTPKSIEQSEVVYVNAKRAPHLLRQLGFKESSVRDPGLLSAQGMGAGYSFIGSIHDAGGVVNTHGEPFGNVFDYRYSLSGEEDDLFQAFVAAYEDGQGTGQLERDYPTIQQQLREARREQRRAEKRADSEQAKRLVAQKATKEAKIAWEMYHKRVLRKTRRDLNDKINQERKEHAKAIREAVAQTKEVERAKAAVDMDAQRMAAGREAAKRLGIREDTYGKKNQERKEKEILRRNAAKATLRNQALADRKRAQIEAEQGPVDTMRKSPQERSFRQKLATAAEKLRVTGRDLYAKFVSQAAEIERVGKRQTGMRADTLATILGGVGSTVNYIFSEGLVDRAGDTIGGSMTDVFLCTVEDKGTVIDEPRQALFQDYLLHRHNIDRMSMVERALERLEAMERQYPWLREADPREIARLAALTDAEAKKLGQEQAREIARIYNWLNQSYLEAKNKPVFADTQGNPISADTSRGRVAQLEQEAPWLVEKAKGVDEWWDKFMRAWVVGDSISEEQYAHMRAVYPHYVPTYRVDKGGAGVSFFAGKGLSSGKYTREAVGSVKEIVNVEDSFANLVQKAVRQARANELFKNLVDTAMLDNDGTFADSLYFDWIEYGQNAGAGDLARVDIGEDLEHREGAGLTKDGDGYRVSAWYNGELVHCYVSEALYKSLSLTTGHSSDRLDKVARLGSKLTSPMKTAITGINPNFALRNVMRDVPTAIVNSTSGLAFPKWWAIAWKEMIARSDNWRHYQALGGGDALYYNNEGGYGANMNMRAGAKGKAQRGWNKVKAVANFINESTESVTRFAEYLATIDKLGDTYEGRLQARKNAAEVTVDFSRHGEYGKAINAWIPYWNPAVQGIDKVFRSVVDTPQGQTKLGHALRTLGKAAATTALVEAVFQIIYTALGKRKDWEQLDDRTKDTYYCIPTGDHKFIKIPKNREWGAILGTPLMRLWEWGYGGRENPFENFLETSIIPNFLPGMPLTFDDGKIRSDIIGISQALDIANNSDFAGRTIVPYAYQQGSKKGQYDSDTSVLSKWLSDAIGSRLSPMQVDYIIKDYFGDFGKMFTMATSAGFLSGEKTPEEVAAYALDIVQNPWESDNRFSNQYTSRYYEVMDALEDEYNDIKNHEDGDAYKDSIEYQTYQAITKQYGKEITALNKDIRNETNEDKKAEAKARIVELAKAALDLYDRCMRGEVKRPDLAVEYDALPQGVSDALINLDSYAGDYGIKPSEYNSKTISDTTGLKIGNSYIMQYELDDAAKDKYNEIRQAYYDEYLAKVASSSSFKSAKPEDQASMLEDARSDAYSAASDEFHDWLKKNRTPTMKPDKDLPAAYRALSDGTKKELASLAGQAGTEKYTYTPSDSTTKSYTDPTSKVGKAKATREYVLDDEAMDYHNKLRQQYYETYVSRVMQSAAYRNASAARKAEMLADARTNAYEQAKEEFMTWLQMNRTATPRD